MKSIFKYCLYLCAFFLWSCDQEDVISVDSDAIGVVVKEFEPEDGSRIDVTVNTAGATFVWSPGDKIGTFSDDPLTGDLYFTLSAANGTNLAYFNGGGYALKKNTKYCAYYPYDRLHGAVLNNISVSYSGQAQSGNNSTAHIGNYDFLYCPYTETNDQAGVVFNMNHFGSLVQFNLTVPAVDNLSRMVLAVPATNPLMMRGTYDLSSDTPVFTPTSTSTKIEVSLSNIQTTAGDVVTIYAMLPPCDYSAADVYLTVYLYGSHVYYSTVKGKKFQASKIHKFDAYMVAQ